MLCPLLWKNEIEATKGTGEGQIIQRTRRQTIFDRFTMPTIKRKKINVSIVIHLLPRSKRNKRSLTTMKKKSHRPSNLWWLNSAAAEIFSLCHPTCFVSLLYFSILSPFPIHIYACNFFLLFQTLLLLLLPLPLFKSSKGFFPSTPPSMTGWKFRALLSTPSPIWNFKSSGKKFKEKHFFLVWWIPRRGGRIR